jgi:hypothetical protein
MTGRRRLTHRTKRHRTKFSRNTLIGGGQIEDVYPYWQKYITFDDQCFKKGDFAYCKQDMDYGIENELIIKDKKLDQLDIGFYTYVVNTDHVVVYGKVTNSMEFGVKHINLAESLENKKIIMAGECQIKSDICFINSSSGNYSLKLVKNTDKTINNSLSRLLSNSIQTFFDCPCVRGKKYIKFVDRPLFTKMNPPTQDEMETMNTWRKINPVPVLSATHTLLVGDTTP